MFNIFKTKKNKESLYSKPKIPMKSFLEFKVKYIENSKGIKYASIPDLVSMFEQYKSKISDDKVMSFIDDLLECFLDLEKK